MTTIHLDFEQTSCCGCGIVFFVPTRFMEGKRANKTTYYCPNGHALSYQESTSDKLRRERDRLKQSLAEKDDEIRHQRERVERVQRTASAYRGQVTKIKRRVSGGACPCCNRHFTNLERHMAAKHPGFSDEEPPELKVIEGGAA